MSGLFLVLFGDVALVLFLVSHCLIPFSYTKAVESFKSQWKGTGLTPGLMSWCSEYWGGPCSGCWFLVRFSDLILGCQDNGFIQERGVVAGTRVGVVILVPVFLGALVAVFLVVLVFFRALSWLQFRAWTGVGFLRGRLVVFFVAVLVGPFVAVLVVVLLFAFV